MIWRPNHQSKSDRAINQAIMDKVSTKPSRLSVKVRNPSSGLGQISKEPITSTSESDEGDQVLSTAAIGAAWETLAKLEVPPTSALDKTPTPVRFLEASGLLNEVNPFDEHFRKAREAQEQLENETNDIEHNEEEGELHTPKINVQGVVTMSGGLITALPDPQSSSSSVQSLPSPLAIRDDKQVIVSNYRPILPTSFIKSDDNTSFGNNKLSPQLVYTLVNNTPVGHVTKRARKRTNPDILEKSGSTTTSDCGDPKRQRLLERNRAAAQRSRMKKKAISAQMQMKMDELTRSRQALLTENRCLRQEVVNLRALLRNHVDCPVAIANNEQEAIRRHLGLETQNVVVLKTPENNTETQHVKRKIMNRMLNIKAASSNH